MNGNGSPLEHLATLISLTFGVSATVFLSLYSRWLERRALEKGAPDSYRR
jgi:hypothetical protein